MARRRGIAKYGAAWCDVYSFLVDVVYVIIIIIIIIISISISIIIVAFIFTMLENLECALEGSPPLHFLAVGCTSQKSGGGGDLQKYLPAPCGGVRKAGKHRLRSSEVQSIFPDLPEHVRAHRFSDVRRVNVLHDEMLHWHAVEMFPKRTEEKHIPFMYV